VLGPIAAHHAALPVGMRRQITHRQ
jgi:hypothetical protein